MTSLYEVLKASRIPSSAPDMYTALWAKVLTGGGYTPTEHQYTGEVPTVIIANGEPLISCLIYGNMSQTGTPSPTTPIQPQECGERTGNLFDYTAATIGKYINASGQEVSSGGSTVATKLNHTDYISITSGSSYTISTPALGSNTGAFCWFDSSKTLLSRDTFEAKEPSYTISSTAPQNAAFMIVNYTTTNQQSVMLNTASTALPFEPYGIKIPILSANTTTPVYLGEVQSTRRIKKLVLDGTESTWRITGSGRLAVEIPVDGIIGQYCVCSHYKGTNVTSLSSLNDKECEVGTLNSSNKQEFVVYDTDYSTAAAFKTYLQQQYAAGTPVCVWYVLATPTTGIVNEPIRKIGEYADSVSASNVPTIAGSQTFDVETNLKPSSVDITYIG